MSFYPKVFITNVATLVTLTVNGEEFAPCIRLLLKHQSLIDVFACLVSAITVLQKPLWLSGKKRQLHLISEMSSKYLELFLSLTGCLFSFIGVRILDFIICMWWHTNAFYWGSLFVSICNLILVAFERQVFNVV